MGTTWGQLWGRSWGQLDGRGRERVRAAARSVAGSTVVGMADPPPLVEVRRSARRRRMVSARREGDTVVVFIPGWMSADEESRWVDEMVRRLERSEARRRSPARTGDEALGRKATELSR